jgi:antitoxin ChpS
MELLVEKWDDGAALRLPAELLALLKVTLGEKLSVTVGPDGVLLKTFRAAYSLDDLLAQCDPSSPEPADMSPWFGVWPLGREWP